MSTAAAQTITEVVEQAIAYHPQVRRDQALAVAADQNVEVAYSDFLPDLDVEASSGVEVTNSPTTRATQGTVTEHRSEARATLTQLLFDFYGTANQVEARRDLLRASHADLQASSENIARLAIEQYLGVVLAREAVELVERNVGDHVAIVDLIRGRTEAGRAAEVDVDQAGARLSLVRAELVQSLGLEAQAVSRYIETVGEEPGDLPRPPEPDVAIAGDLDAALAVAMDRNPLAHSTSAVWDARKDQVDSARSAYYPRFDVLATAGVGENLDGVEGGRTDASVLLRMQWNLFSGFGDLARVRRATFEANAANRSDAEARRAIREAVRLAYDNVVSTEARLTPLRNDVAASRQTFSAYREQYDVGQRTLLDLLDARDEQFDSETELLAAEFQRYRAYYDLLFATGTLLESLGITIYEPELQFDERGEGINRAALSEGLEAADGSLPVEGEFQPSVATSDTDSEGAAAEVAAVQPVNMQIDAGLPGAGEFGYWLAPEGQRTIAAPDAEEAAALVQTSAASEVAPTEVRREIAEIEVESVPVMAELPETSVGTLPAVAFGEETPGDAAAAIASEGFKAEEAPLPQPANAGASDQSASSEEPEVLDQRSDAGLDRFGLMLEELAALPAAESEASPFLAQADRR